MASSESAKNLYNIGQPELTRYSQAKLPAKSVQTYRISNTQRSSLVREDGLPGPGSYNWSQYFESKRDKESKPKGKIQYKFVYGHPS